MPGALTRAEIAKDALQDAAEATVTAVARVGGAVTTAATDVIGAVGSLGTDLFEIGEAARRAAVDQRPPIRLVREADPGTEDVSRAG